MASQIDELTRQRNRLVALVGTEQENGLVGSLRVELASVQQEVSDASVDTPTEKVVAALQRETALTTRISRGESELKHVESELHHRRQIEANAQHVGARREREQQQRRAGVVAQIRVIDDQLAGRKPIHAATGPAGSDYVGNMAVARHHLRQTRERVMRENGLTEADVTPPVPANNDAQLRPDGRGWT